MNRAVRLGYGAAGSARRSLGRRAATLTLMLGGTTLLVGAGQDERRH